MLLLAIGNNLKLTSDCFPTDLSGIIHLPVHAMKLNDKRSRPTYNRYKHQLLPVSCTSYKLLQLLHNTYLFRNPV